MCGEANFASTRQEKLSGRLVSGNQLVVVFCNMAESLSGRCRSACRGSLQSGDQRRSDLERRCKPWKELQVSVVPSLSAILRIQQDIATAGLLKDAKKLLAIDAYKASGCRKSTVTVHFRFGRLVGRCRHKTSSGSYSNGAQVSKYICSALVVRDAFQWAIVGSMLWVGRNSSRIV